MSAAVDTPLVRLSNIFPDIPVHAKCEHLAPSGSFKAHGANHLLSYLTRQEGPRRLVVPSMGNTALGAAVAARHFDFAMTAVVPQTIARAKDEKLHALGVELVKIAGGGTDLLQRATQLAQEQNAYFVHPHLDRLWTDGYQAIAAQILRAVPDCRSLVFPVGGGGLLMGLTAYLTGSGGQVKLHGCEPYNYPKYATYSHQRSRTIADGLILETPHPAVQARVKAAEVFLHLIAEADIRAAMRELYWKHGLVVEPSSAIAVALVQAKCRQLEGPICCILTGGNIAAEDFNRLIAADVP